MKTPLTDLIEAASARAIPAAVTAMAEHVRAGHPGALAVLAYGSSLRGETLNDTLIDFYVLTADFHGVSANRLSRLGCRMAPPNVYYAEQAADGQMLRAKYAVLPLPLFCKRMSRETDNPYFWARFAQGPALVWTESATARATVIAALATATTTMFANALSVKGANELATWEAGFRETYRTELRSEGPERARELVNANSRFFEQAGAMLAREVPVSSHWPSRRAKGKLLSVARLVKAAFKFQGGADNAAWKIARHSGVIIEVTDWQRRHPILGGLMLLPKLLRKGALR